MARSFVCEKCGSSEIYCRRTVKMRDRVLRYRKCDECGEQFQTLETRAIVPRDVPNDAEKVLSAVKFEKTAQY